MNSCTNGTERENRQSDNRRSKEKEEGREKYGRKEFRSTKIAWTTKKLEKMRAERTPEKEYKQHKVAGKELER